MGGSFIAEEEVARRLFARERYDDFLAYDTASRDKGAALHRAAALAATNHASDAAAALRTIDRSKVDPKRLAFLQRAITQPGRLFDRNGNSISNAADFAPFVASLPRGHSTYVCKGELPIDGRHFGDWVPSGHGKLAGIDDALAVSCNVFFADVGLRLGRERLQRFMKAAGFGGQTNTGIV